MKPIPLALVALSLSFVNANAAEVQFEGFYQTRGRLFDTLSLDREIDANEGLTWYVQHRLWLRPKFFVTDKVAIMADIRGLDGVVWGNRPESWLDPVTQVAVPTIFTDDLQAPVNGSDGSGTLSNLALWRTWGEVHTKIGTFKFGRQPLHWGLGLWQNDGLATSADYGDSADRLSWEHTFSGVWVQAAADVSAEGLINNADDTTAFSLAGAYRSERITGGVQLQYKRSTGEQTKFNLFTADAAFDIHLGIVGIAGEAVVQAGSGDLDGGINDVRTLGVGAVLDLSVKTEKIEAHLEGGVATGDGDNANNKLRTFTFDRDYNVGIIMFEQALPVLQSTVPGEDRSYAATLTGNAVSNVMYLKPKISYRLLPGFFADASILAARTAKVPEAEKTPDRRSYGFEINAGLHYTGIDHFELAGTFATFIPGTRFRNFTDDTFSGFKAPVFGGQLMARIKF